MSALARSWERLDHPGHAPMNRVVYECLSHPGSSKLAALWGLLNLVLVLLAVGLVALHDLVSFGDAFFDV